MISSLRFSRLVYSKSYLSFQSQIKWLNYIIRLSSIHLTFNSLQSTKLTTQFNQFFIVESNSKTNSKTNSKPNSRTNSFISKQPFVNLTKRTYHLPKLIYKSIDEFKTSIYNSSFRSTFLSRSNQLNFVQSRFYSHCVNHQINSKSNDKTSVDQSEIVLANDHPSNEKLDNKSIHHLDEKLKNSPSFTSFNHQLKLPFVKMKEIPNYDDAIRTLNSLQSNRAAIQNRIINPTTLAAKVKRTQDQLHYLGVSQSDLKSMNIVHLSGTKGKGSTCAFIESILRKKRFRTGLFTSPHLVSVRERIQLNGDPIEKDLFARNFFHVYNKLKNYDAERNGNDPTRNHQSIDDDYENTMPFYFNFLTLMAFYTFKQQGCNATILEVGIGGEFDCTNIVDQPIVVGISSLGIDHTKLLGNTIEEIAWHKSGIFKRNVKAFTSDNQKIEALAVLLDRAKERDCSIQICPSLNDYQTDNRTIKLGINGSVQRLNASLALQISDHFLQTVSTNHSNHLNHPNCAINHSNDQINQQLYANSFKIDNDCLDAIEQCRWRGRFEMIKLKNKLTFYLDGAHTVESLNYCIDWFKSECLSNSINEQFKNEKFFKILIFNCTGYRDYQQLLSPLLNAEKFDMICFTTNRKRLDDLNNTKSDLFYVDDELINRDAFKENVLKSLHFTGSVKHFDCLSNCLKSISIKNEENLLNNLQTKVLVTGSIHLIGGVISLINEQYC